MTSIIMPRSAGIRIFEYFSMPLLNSTDDDAQCHEHEDAVVENHSLLFFSDFAVIVSLRVLWFESHQYWKNALLYQRHC